MRSERGACRVFDSAPPSLEGEFVAPVPKSAARTVCACAAVKRGDSPDELRNEPRSRKAERLEPPGVEESDSSSPSAEPQRAELPRPEPRPCSSSLGLSTVERRVKASVKRARRERRSVEGDGSSSGVAMACGRRSASAAEVRVVAAATAELLRSEPNRRGTGADADLGVPLRTMRSTGVDADGMASGEGRSPEARRVRVTTSGELFLGLLFASGEGPWRGDLPCSDESERAAIMAFCSSEVCSSTSGGAGVTGAPYFLDESGDTLFLFISASRSLVWCRSWRWAMT